MKKIIITLGFFLLLFKPQFLQAQIVLTWNDCLAEAAKNHPDLISAEESVKQAQEDKKISKSPALPQVDASLDASRAKAKTIVLGKAATKVSNSFQYGVNASQLVFDGAQTGNSVKSAEENIKAAGFNYTFVSAELRLRLRSAFVSLLKAQESLKIAQEIFSIRRSNLELITLRYESGMEHRGALLTAQANLAQAEFDIAQNKRALIVAQRDLTKEMGRDVFAPFTVEANFEVGKQSLEDVDFTSIVENHPSLLQAAALKNSAFFSSKAIQGDFFPELSVSAGAHKSGSRWAPRDEQIDMGFSLSVPLFEGGLRNARLAKARSEYKQAQADERSLKDGLFAELEGKKAALHDAVEAVQVERKFLDAAIERSKIAEAQYSLGLIEFDNWTIIEDDLVRAKQNLLNAQANALTAEADWNFAKGETLEYAR